MTKQIITLRKIQLQDIMSYKKANKSLATNYFVNNNYFTKG